MTPAVLMIDGGSTNTRFTLFLDGKIAERTKKSAGASGGAQTLAQTVRAQIAAFEEKWSCTIAEIYASGMITSESGLAQIAHIEGPAGLDEFARSVTKRRLPELSRQATFYFVPGVKFGAGAPLGADLVRGEEVELFGAIDEGTEEKARAFVHFGSHNKLLCYRGGRIESSVTTLSGELLWAVRQDTILKNTLHDMSAFAPRKAHILRGFHAAQEAGLTRALFSVRTMDIVERETPEAIWSYLYGALFAEDLRAFAPALDARLGEIVLYGRDEFIKTAQICLAGIGKPLPPIRCISHEQSEWLSVLGMQRIRKRRLELLGRASEAAMLSVTGEKIEKGENHHEK